MNPSIHHSISITRLLLWDPARLCLEGSGESVAAGPTSEAINVSILFRIMTLGHNMHLAPL